MCGFGAIGSRERADIRPVNAGSLLSGGNHSKETPAIKSVSHPNPQIPEGCRGRGEMQMKTSENETENEGKKTKKRRHIFPVVVNRNMRMSNLKNFPRKFPKSPKTRMDTFRGNAWRPFTGPHPTSEGGISRLEITPFALLKTRTAFAPFR